MIKKAKFVAITEREDLESFLARTTRYFERKNELKIPAQFQIQGNILRFTTAIR